MADLPVISFIQERLAESDASLETRKGSGFYDLFVKPQELMLQPLLSAMETVLTAQSVRRILDLDDPNSFDSVLVDDLAANSYVERTTGANAITIVRVFYADAKDLELPELSGQFTSGSLNFFNSSDVVVSKSQMAIQQAGTLFYVDIPVVAELPGDSYNVDVGAITTFVNDPDTVSVTNLTKAQGGVAAETNTELLIRARNSVGVRDLETVKGINAILREKFPTIQEIRPIGMGDPEMMRDILYNTHVGGKTDVYIKTPSIGTSQADILGITFDSTRSIPKNVHMELTATTFNNELSYLGNLYIVSGSLTVKDDVVETAAQIVTTSVPAPAGINLSSSEWIRLKVDNGLFRDIKISGATPSATQKFEIINAINSTMGLVVATPYGTDKILIKSPTIGADSVLTLTQPTSPRTDGTLTLIPSASSAGYNLTPPMSDGVFKGVTAESYIENYDFQIDYENGKIIKLPGSAIKSGDTVASHLVSGFGNITAGSNVFQSPIPGAFSDVRVGDELIITASTVIDPGSLPATYLVSEVTNNQSLKILGLDPTGADALVQYSIISHHTVVIDYGFNPLSIDIGNKVLLSDGITRGIRPGRENYTITGMAFIGISSIEEIDPDTKEGLGIFLTPAGGYGGGGYGEGSYGRDSAGDYELIINEPNYRFSAFEDAVLVFDPSLFGKSYKVTYFSNLDIPSIHSVCRDDSERVTGADVLPKNFIPGFVDISITIRVKASNTAIPTVSELEQMVSNLVDDTEAGEGLKASDIIRLLEEAGADSVLTPFTMTATVLNPAGGASVYSDEDILTVPEVELAKETENFTTPRIVHFYPRNIVITEVTI